MRDSCGHNLIAIAGVAVALALKAAMESHRISGKIILLGTPGMGPVLLVEQTLTPVIAEESGGGKILLLDNGAYEEMDVCVMSVSSSPRTGVRGCRANLPIS